MKPTSPAELLKWALKLLRSTRLILNTLTIGPMVNIFIGEPGNDYTAIKSAYATLLSHLSSYCRKKLADKSSQCLNIHFGDKNTLLFIYRWMLSGERNSDAKGTLKLDGLMVPDLINLCHHCVFLKCEVLKEKTAKDTPVFSSDHICSNVLQS